MGLLFEVEEDTASRAEEIYKAYPRKVGKQVALRAIRSALRIRKYSELLEATKAYAKAVSKWSIRDKQFIPHPSTFFTQGRYDDDRDEWKRGQDDPDSENFDPTRILR